MNTGETLDEEGAMDEDSETEITEVPPTPALTETQGTTTLEKARTTEAQGVKKS